MRGRATPRRFLGIASIGCAAALGMPSAPMASAATVSSTTWSSAGMLPMWFDSQGCPEGSTEFYEPTSDEERGLLASSQINLAAAHELSKGQDITIAIVDTGINSSNPAFTGATFSTGFDVTGTDAYTDNEGHGTAVASVIVGQVDQRGSIDGVAPRASIVSVKVVDKEPASNASEEELKAYQASLMSNLVAGIDWAADQPNIDIISISIASADDNDALRGAVAKAHANGKIVVAAAGNAETGSETGDAAVRYPAAYDGVIGVTATNAAGDIDGSTLHSSAVDLTAPGMNVVVANGSTGVCLSSTVAPATSFATAYVAGSAALVKAQYPSESSEMIAFRLMSSASRGSATVRSDMTGWGMVNPYEAITLVDDGQLPGPDSPRVERKPVEPNPGSQVPPQATDLQANSRTSSLIWTGVSVGATTIVLIASAGISRTARRNREDD